MTLDWKKILPPWMVGLERIPLPAEVSQALSQLGLPSSPGVDTEVLLEALGAVRLADRVTPPRIQGPPKPDHPPISESLPVCGPEAVRMLRAVLGGMFPEVLHELLGLLAYHRVQPPPELLPDLLEVLVRRGDCKDSSRAALGSTGKWLAMQHPVWQKLYTPPESEWHTGVVSARIGLLRQLHAANPAEARDLLWSTWSQDPPDARQAFLSIIANHPAPDDLELLTHALSDRSQQVRATAFAGLMKISESEWAQRAAVFFQQRLAGAVDPAKREKSLSRQFPELDHPEVQPWIPLLPTASKARWREGLLVFFLGHYPVFYSDKAAQWLKKLAGDKVNPEFFNASLCGIARFGPQNMLPAVAEHLAAALDHPAWRQGGVGALQGAWPFEFAIALLRTGPASASLLLHLSENLASMRRSWPRELILLFLQATESTWGGAFYDAAHPPIWLEAVHTAAIYCNITDAEAVETVLYGQFTPRPGPLQAFFDIIVFRKRYWRAIAENI